MTDYFVFCSYEISFQSSCLFVPMTTDENSLGTITTESISTKINELLSFGNKIFGNMVKTETDKGNKTRIKIYETQYLNESETKNEIINYWISLNEQVKHDHEGDYPDDYLTYIINDENKALSPNELFDVLLNIKELHGIKINVKHVVMVSEIKFDKKKDIIMSFFAPLTYSIDQLNDLFGNDRRILKIKYAKDGENKFKGYGFLMIRSNEDEQTLINCPKLIGKNISFY